MKIYLSYKFKGADRASLRKNLEKTSWIIDSSGCESFVFLRDVRHWNFEKDITVKI